jgi:hypothetical protein
MVPEDGPCLLETWEIPGTGDDGGCFAIMDRKPNPPIYERKGDPGLNEKRVYVFKHMGPFSDLYKGVVAKSETEAWEYAAMRGWRLLQLIRIEPYEKSLYEKHNN